MSGPEPTPGGGTSLYNILTYSNESGNLMFHDGTSDSSPVLAMVRVEQNPMTREFVFYPAAGISDDCALHVPEAVEEKPDLSSTANITLWCQH